MAMMMMMMMMKLIPCDFFSTFCLGFWAFLGTGQFWRNFQTARRQTALRLSQTPEKREREG